MVDLEKDTRIIEAQLPEHLNACIICGSSQIANEIDLGEDRKFPLCPKHLAEFNNGILQIKEYETGELEFQRQDEEGEWKSIVPSIFRTQPAEEDIIHIFQELMQLDRPNDFFKALEDVAISWDFQSHEFLLNVAKGIDVKARLIMARLAYEQAKSRGLKEAAEITGFSYSYLREWSYIWQRLGSKLQKTNIIFNLDWTYYARAARTPDPIRALEWAEDRKHQGLSLSIKEFEQARKRGFNDKEAPSPDQTVVSCRTCQYYILLPQDTLLKAFGPTGQYYGQWEISYSEREFCSHFSKPIKIFSNIYAKAEDCKDNGIYILKEDRYENSKTYE